MKNLRSLLFLLPFMVILFSCEEDVDDMMDDNDSENDDDNSVNIVAMTVENSGAAAYFVSGISGNEEVSPLNEDNSTWQLTVGTRYQLTVSGASSHPLALRDSEDNILLSMNDIEGSFETDVDVDFKSDATSFDFTLTEELADELNNYVCTVHARMTGSVTIN
ncbi:hypothetical protein [Marivirga harenae]|uniref:hypothetical protein n=1 Tax=Marivirga harenae TaxID=2010992 RepID=UPI0026DFC3A8|nr:hypothetical protein [Marivirga harenae]WKV11929.1 hypothetical protein Q3Y49_17140 [Marivirga harenae]